MHTEYQATNNTQNIKKLTMHTEYEATNNAHRIIVYKNNFYPKTRLTVQQLLQITQVKTQNNVLAHTSSVQRQNSNTILFTSR